MQISVKDKPINNSEITGIKSFKLDGLLLEVRITMGMRGNKQEMMMLRILEQGRPRTINHICPIWDTRSAYNILLSTERV